MLSSNFWKMNLRAAIGGVFKSCPSPNRSGAGESRIFSKRELKGKRPRFYPMGGMNFARWKMMDSVTVNNANPDGERQSIYTNNLLPHKIWDVRG
jgi:hypothetical protein